MSGEGKGPARGYSWPPAEPGNDLAVKHGAFSEAKLKPRAEEIATELRELVPMGNPSDNPSIWVLAGILARIERARDWLDSQPHGIFRNGQGEPQGVLKMLSVWENSASRLADKLGLTLAGRAEVGVNLASAGALLKRRDLSALSPEELGQLRQLVVKAENGEIDAHD